MPTEEWINGDFGTRFWTLLHGPGFGALYLQLPENELEIVHPDSHRLLICPSSAAHLSAQEQGAAAAMSKVGAQIAFEGSVREEENHIRVNARIVDAAGFQLWATRFDADRAVHTMFAIEEQIAAGPRHFRAVAHIRLLARRPSQCAI